MRAPGSWRLSNASADCMQARAEVNICATKSTSGISKTWPCKRHKYTNNKCDYMRTTASPIKGSCNGCIRCPCAERFAAKPGACRAFPLLARHALASAAQNAAICASEDADKMYSFGCERIPPLAVDLCGRSAVQHPRSREPLAAPTSTASAGYHKCDPVAEVSTSRQIANASATSALATGRRPCRISTLLMFNSTIATL